MYILHINNIVFCRKQKQLIVEKVHILGRIRNSLVQDSARVLLETTPFKIWVYGETEFRILIWNAIFQSIRIETLRHEFSKRNFKIAIKWHKYFWNYFKSSTNIFLNLIQILFIGPQLLSPMKNIKYLYSMFQNSTHTFCDFFINRFLLDKWDNRLNKQINSIFWMFSLFAL